MLSTIGATSPNCTLGAAGSLPSLPSLPGFSRFFARRVLGRRPLKPGIPLKTFLVDLASLQPFFRSIYSARLQARLETKSRATKGARLRLKTYVRCHFLVRT